MTSPLVYEKVWFEKPKFDTAERQYYERLAKVVFGSSINAAALNSTPVLEGQPQLKAFSLMDNKVCCNTEKYSGALNEIENSSQKQGKSCVDLGDAGKTIPPVMGLAYSDGPLKEEKRSKKEKKIRNKERKRDLKKQQLCNKLGDQDTITGKDNSISFPNPKESVSFQSNPVTSFFNVSEGGSLLGKCEGNETTAKVWHGGKTSVLESCIASVHEVDPRKSLEKGSSNSPMKDSLASEVAKARQHIKQSLECMDDIAAMAGNNSDLVSRINSLEKENAGLKKIVEDLKNLALGLDSRVKHLESGKIASAPSPASAPAKTAKNEDDDDDGVDLFGSDSEEENEEAAKIREQRLAAYAEKKSKKPALIAKSNIILSVSPWDDETDMKKMEACVRTIEMDGLMWGASQLVPLAYGIHKLHISCVVEDDKVSVDLLQEKIQDFEDYVQSVDIAAFNKV